MKEILSYFILSLGSHTDTSWPTQGITKGGRFTADHVSQDIAVHIYVLDTIDLCHETPPAERILQQIPS